MIKEIEKVTTESLKSMCDKQVMVKMRSGRVMSGLLKGTDDMFTVKLGVKNIRVEPADVARIFTT